MILGGIGEDQILSDCLAFNVSFRTWENYQLKGNKPDKREKSSVCLYRSKACMMLFGGYYLKFY